MFGMMWVVELGIACVRDVTVTIFYQVLSVNIKLRIYDSQVLSLLRFLTLFGVQVPG